MSEYVITQKQDLINIANAIREKTETTEGMGVEEMTALIAAIKKGADLSPIKLTEIRCGNVTSTGGGVGYITHNLGIMPKIIMVFTDEITTLLNSRIYTFFYTMAYTFTDSSGADKTYYNTVTKTASSSNFTSFSNSVRDGVFNASSGDYYLLGVTSVDEYKFEIRIRDGGYNSYYPCTGVTYFWICLG